MFIIKFRILIIIVIFNFILIYWLIFNWIFSILIIFIFSMSFITILFLISLFFFVGIICLYWINFLILIRRSIFMVNDIKLKIISQMGLFCSSNNSIMLCISMHILLSIVLHFHCLEHLFILCSCPKFSWISHMWIICKWFNITLYFCILGVVNLRAILQAACTYDVNFLSFGLI